ncbi:MAG: DUF3313 family protein [Halioglobus sp.]
MKTSPLNATLMIACFILITACASNSPPQETHDGLVLTDKGKADEVYMRPGASLKDYKEFGISECQVAFRKNWLRDQNTSRVDLSSRVTQEDVDRIKDSLAMECDNKFRAALQEAPAYAVVDDFDEGQAVLILRPSIINLDINAPDTMSPGRSRSYTTSAGEMTLFLEILDGTTGQILARVIDKQRGMDTGRMQWTNGVTNKSDANRALKRWADQLRQALDRATAD